MLPFLRRCLAFATIVTAIAMASYLLNAALFAALPYRVPAGIRTLVVGDSQAAHAMNPDVLPDSLSIARPGEGLCLTLENLRHVLPEAPDLETVLVSVGPIKVAAMNDRPFRADWQPTIAKRYHALVNPLTHPGMRLSRSARIGEFARWRLTPSREYVRGAVERLAGRSWRPPAFRGGFVNAGGQRRSQGAEERLLETRFGRGDEGLSKTHVAALRSIVSLCHENGVRLLLVRVPTQPHYHELIPEAVERQFRAVLDALPKSDEWAYVDLSGLELPPEEFFDYDHVNVDGSRRVSRRLVEEMARDR